MEFILLGRYGYVECRLRTRFRAYGLPLVNLLVGWPCNKSYRRSWPGSTKYLVLIWTRAVNIDGNSTRSSEHSRRYQAIQHTQKSIRKKRALEESRTAGIRETNVRPKLEIANSLIIIMDGKLPYFYDL